jgi:hypothetical protein
VETASRQASGLRELITTRAPRDATARATASSTAWIETHASAVCLPKFKSFSFLAPLRPGLGFDGDTHCPNPTRCCWTPNKYASILYGVIRFVKPGCKFDGERSQDIGAFCGAHPRRSDRVDNLKPPYDRQRSMKGKQ